MDVPWWWFYPDAMILNLWTAFASAVLVWWAQLGWYPALRAEAPERFRAAHDRHLRKLGWLAPPVMLADLAATGWLAANIAFWWGKLVWNPAWHFSSYAAAAIAVTGIGWVSTFALQVPLHNRLREGRDPAALDALLSTNRIRVAAWSAKGMVLAVWLAIARA